LEVTIGLYFHKGRIAEIEIYTRIAPFMAALYGNPLDSKQVVSLEELLMSRVGQAGSSYQTACRERDIHQGVLGDGKGDKSEDE
jgi:hypothetical protein